MKSFVCWLEDLLLSRFDLSQESPSERDEDLFSVPEPEKLLFVGLCSCDVDLDEK